MARTREIDRRTDLDWLRIGAFALLILYHVAMFYVPWDWTVKSLRLLPWLEIPMDWSSPWRLLVLFVVSGAATRFMADKLAPGALLAMRSHRLLLPLLFGIAIVIPPQSYLQAVEQFGYQGSFGDFLGLYLHPGRDLCRDDGACLFLPRWEHMWFVGYIWFYTVLLIAVLKWAPRAVGQLRKAGEAWLSGARLIWMPIVVLFLAALGLRHFFPPTHNFYDDWYLHPVYLFCFLFGYLFARSAAIWVGFMRWRWIALGLALVAYGLDAAYAWHYQGRLAPFALRLTMVPVEAVDQWAWTAAALGFARRHLVDRDGPVRRYLTEAIFPFYIVHQTIIVVVAHNVAKLGLPIGLEAGILIASTVAGCALTVELVRRISWLRPWFGLKRVARSSTVCAKFDPPIESVRT